MNESERQRRKARLRAAVKGCYDLQQLRMQQGLRLCANFRAQLREEDAEDKTTGDLSEDAKKVVTELKEHYKRLTDGIAKNRTLPAKEGFKGDDLIDDYTSLVLVHHYVEMERVERSQFSHLEDLLTDWPIYSEWLTTITGIGPAMAGVLLAYIDVAKAKYVTNLWAYAGLDVGPDGLGRSRRKEHLIEREYTAKDGSTQKRLSITFEPFLKTKLTVLGISFLRTGSPYARLYRQYRHRLETDPHRIKATSALIEQYKKEGKEWRRELWSPRRIHEASLRWMVKMFLKDLWLKWRTMEGLPTGQSYHEAYHGHIHGAGPLPDPIDPVDLAAD